MVALVYVQGTFPPPHLSQHFCRITFLTGYHLYFPVASAPECFFTYLLANFVEKFPFTSFAHIFF